jgi:hypothetical protein
MAFPDYSYDVYEDFEDALGAPWTEVDGDNNLDPNNAAAKYYGSYGMRINDVGDTAGKDIAYILGNFGAAKTAISIGFWYKIPNASDAWWGAHKKIIFGQDNDGYPFIVEMYDAQQGAAPYIRIRNDGTYSDPINLTVNTWYWVTIKAVQNDTCYMRAYNEDHDQVGNEVTVTGEDKTCQYLFFGNVTAPAWDDTGLNIDWDDLVIDYTDATFPLLGWETGGEPPAGGITTQAAAYLRGYRKNNDVWIGMT